MNRGQFWEINLRIINIPYREFKFSPSLRIATLKGEIQMKQLVIGLSIGFAIGLTCTACSLALPTIKAEPSTVVLTDRNFVQTTKVTTDEGTYRIFTIEGNNRNGVGITAIKIK